MTLGLARDPHSHARPDEVVVRRMALDLDVSFEQRRLSGSVTLDVERVDPDATRLVLDTWHLELGAVTDGNGTPLAHGLGEHDAILGAPLTVELGPAGDGPDRVVVHYATTEDAQALQWLDPAQTSSGKQFLFTQSQPILARSWIPCQDSPGIRAPYDAVVRVPAELGLMAVMSAENPIAPTADGSYRFTMPEPVPSYLVALAVGDLEFREMGPRTGVYAEPQVVEAAAWEFADTERMVEAAERLYGPYRWGRYDLLVLPPSFPYGGMENPRLTFATPTVITGDRSLVSLVAHELAHSWSGNLVTNATWNDLWLNEGFTTYFETRIDEEVFGADYTSMLLRLGRQELEKTLDGAESHQTVLHAELEDPDGYLPKLPYEKGSLFLRALEARVGRARFDAFLRAYFDRHAFGSMDTPAFLAHLEAELLTPAGLMPGDVGVEEWIHGPGVPEDAPAFTSDAFDLVDAQVAALVAGTPAADLDTDGWTSHQWVHLVRSLPAEHAVLDDVDAAHGFSTSGNIEVATAWFELAVASGWVFERPAADAALADLLTRHGRALYLRKVYAALATTRHGRGRERAQEIYAVARPTYHPVSQGVVDRILA